MNALGRLLLLGIVLCLSSVLLAAADSLTMTQAEIEAFLGRALTPYEAWVTTPEHTAWWKLEATRRAAMQEVAADSLARWDPHHPHGVCWGTPRNPYRYDYSGLRELASTIRDRELSRAVDDLGMTLNNLWGW